MKSKLRARVGVKHQFTRLESVFYGITFFLVFSLLATLVCLQWTIWFVPRVFQWVGLLAMPASGVVAGLIGVAFSKRLPLLVQYFDDSP